MKKSIPIFQRGSWSEMPYEFVASIGFQTTTEDLSTHDGETVSIEVEKGGNASIWVDDIRLWVDSDNDGLSDNEEREGFRVGWGETVTTDVDDPDTDDDGY